MCLATVFPYSLLRTNDNTTQADAMLIYKAKSGCKYIHTHTHTHIKNAFQSVQKC